jgi:hypothetical protein
MQLWHWLLLLGLVFLITYNPRTGNLGSFFAKEVSVEADHASRETQSDSDPDEHSE